MKSRFFDWRISREALPYVASEPLQALLFFRLCLLYFVLSVVLLRQIFLGPTPESTTLYGYAFLAVGFLFNLFHSLGLDWLKTQRGVRWWQFLFDAAIISAWIYAIHREDSLYVLLYLIQVLAVALIFYQKEALWVAILCSFSFGVVTVFTSSSWHLGWFTWGSYSALFVLLGVVGGYLNEQLSKTTARLNLEKHKVEQLTELHEKLITNMPTGFLTVDDQMQITFLNSAAEHILGKNSAHLLGKTIASELPGLETFFDPIEEELVEPTAEVSEIDRETELTATGSAFHRSYFVKSKTEWARLQQTVEYESEQGKRLLRGDVALVDVGLVKSESPKQVMGKLLLFQDVTKILHLEDKVRQHEKLAAVGQLAAGIAHEIRNPLASMSASIEMLKQSLPETHVAPEDRKLMEIALREIDRLNRLISEFLDYVKPQKLEKKRFDLQEVLSELVEAVKRRPEVGSRIILQENCEKSFASGNREKIKQVVWNLLLNAVQAMVRPGKIEVGCCSVSAQRVKLWVRDEGIGMNEKVLAHLYEPFFTTKDKGTGLGLATVYRIVEAHEGDIKVQSTEGKGTLIEVFLPAV